MQSIVSIQAKRHRAVLVSTGHCYAQSAVYDQQRTAANSNIKATYTWYSSSSVSPSSDLLSSSATAASWRVALSSSSKLVSCLSF